MQPSKCNRWILHQCRAIYALHAAVDAVDAVDTQSLLQYKCTPRQSAEVYQVFFRHLSKVGKLCLCSTLVCRDAERARGSARVSDRVSGSARRRHKSRSRSRERGRASGSPYSRGTDTEDGEVKEPSSPMKAGPLSARQQARLADLSLLLEVILKTDYARYVSRCLSCDRRCRDSQQGLWFISCCGIAMCCISLSLSAIAVMCMAALNSSKQTRRKGASSLQM